MLTRGQTRVAAAISCATAVEARKGIPQATDLLSRSTPTILLPDTQHAEKNIEHPYQNQVEELSLRRWPLT